MPSDKATPASNAPKRARTESTRKREGREHAEATKREHAGRKAAAKARKDFRDEAADNDLLVERAGESAELAKLRSYTVQLESDNQRMKAKLARRDKQEDTAPIKLIPVPENKGLIDVKLLRSHLGLIGEDNDAKWSAIRQDFRAVLVAGSLDWDKPWSKQEIDRVNTLYHAAEYRRPEMKQFANHWATEYLLKESFGNLSFYHHRQANKQHDAAATRLPKSGRCASHSHGDSYGNDDKPDTEKDIARKAAAHKAAAYRAADRKAAKRKADTQDGDGRESRQDEDGTPYNDGETEIEDVPDERRKEIERDEIGVPVKSRYPAKDVAKLAPENLDTPMPSTSAPKPRKPSHPHPGKSHVSMSSSSTPQPEQDTLDPTSAPKPRPIIYLKRGRGGKVQGSRRRVLAAIPGRDSTARDDVVSSSSGQTTSESDED